MCKKKKKREFGKKNKLKKRRVKFLNTKSHMLKIWNGLNKKINYPVFAGPATHMFFASTLGALPSSCGFPTTCECVSHSASLWHMGGVSKNVKKKNTRDRKTNELNMSGQQSHSAVFRKGLKSHLFRVHLDSA